MLKIKENTELHEETMKILDNEASKVNQEIALKETQEKDRFLLEKENLQNQARKIDTEKSLETVKENNKLNYNLKELENNHKINEMDMNNKILQITNDF